MNAWQLRHTMNRLEPRVQKTAMEMRVKKVHVRKLREMNGETRNDNRYINSEISGRLTQIKDTEHWKIS